MLFRSKTHQNKFKENDIAYLVNSNDIFKVQIKSIYKKMINYEEINQNESGSFNIDFIDSNKINKKISKHAYIINDNILNSVKTIKYKSNNDEYIIKFYISNFMIFKVDVFLENFIFLVLLFLFSGRDAFFSVLAAVTLTPLGVTFLQQGQFDLYTASCFFLLGITGQGVMEEKRRAGKYFLAGLFAALKWTALPLLLFSVAWDFFLRRTRVSLFALLPVALSLLLPFTRD